MSITPKGQSSKTNGTTVGNITISSASLKQVWVKVSVKPQFGMYKM